MMKFRRLILTWQQMQGPADLQMTSQYEGLALARLLRGQIEISPCLGGPSEGWKSEIAKLIEPNSYF